MSRSLRLPAVLLILALLWGHSKAGQSSARLAGQGAYLPLIFHSSTRPAPVPGRVVISEVMANPSTVEPAGEWIELYNPGDSAVLLDGYKLGDAWAVGDAEGMFSFPPGVVLLPGRVLVIANQAAFFSAVYSFRPNFELRDSDPQVPDLMKYLSWAARNVSLTNSGDEVLLLDPQDQVADALSWGSSIKAFFPSVARSPDGYSLERYPPSRDSNTAQDWRVSGRPAPGVVDLTPPTATPTLTPTVTLTPTHGPFPIPSRTPSLTPTLTPTHTELPPRRLLLITEVVYDPSDPEPYGEWIEIYNADTSTASLADYKIGDEETRLGSEGMLRFPGGSTLNPGQVIVVANRAVTFIARYGFAPDYEMDESDAGIPNMIKYTSWSIGPVLLANTPPHDEVLLLDAADGLVDALSWGISTWAFQPAVPAVAEGHSLERCPANQDSDSAVDWRQQVSPQPGQVNLTCPGAMPSSTPDPALSPLVINEILADPSSTAGDANEDGVIDAGEDEFVELVNRSGVDLDLSGWSIEDASGLRHTFPPGSSLPDHCAAVIFGGGQPSGSFGGSLVQTASAGSLTLRNFGDIVSVFDNSGVLVASYTYGAEGDEDQSLTRSPDITGVDPLVKHSQATGSAGALFSPGTSIDGQAFDGCLTGLTKYQ